MASIHDTAKAVLEALRTIDHVDEEEFRRQGCHLFVHITVKRPEDGQIVHAQTALGGDLTFAAHLKFLMDSIKVMMTSKMNGGKLTDKRFNRLLEREPYWKDGSVGADKDLLNPEETPPKTTL